MAGAPKLLEATFYAIGKDSNLGVVNNQEFLENLLNTAQEWITQTYLLLCFYHIRMDIYYSLTPNDLDYGN